MSLNLVRFFNMHADEPITKDATVTCTTAYSKVCNPYWTMHKSWWKRWKHWRLTIATRMFEDIVIKLKKKQTNYQTLAWVLNMTIFMRITRLIISSTSGPSSGRRRDLCSSDHGKTEREQHSRERGLSLDNKASLFANRHLTINYGSSLTSCL